MPFNNRQFDQVEQAILKTLIYSDIFNFPLTKEELWRFLINDEKIEKGNFEEALNELIRVSRVLRVPQMPRAFYCLTGREFLAQKRKKNFPEVTKKFIIAKKAAYYISLIPTIRFIGISGGLALGNGDKDSDIDFFIITKKNTLFMTRFWILALLEILNLRRKPGEKNSPDKICVNLLIDEEKLSWTKEKQDIYTAHEIIQTLPLFERNDMYKKFLQSNTWIRKYFPNFKKKQLITTEKQTNYFTLKFLGFFIFLFPLEIFIRYLQKHHMKKT